MSKQEITNEQKNRIDELQKSVNEKATQLLTGTSPLKSNEIKMKMEAENKSDLKQYLGYLEKINEKLNSLVEKAEKIKFEEKNLHEQLSALESKRIEVIKREAQLDTGKYAGTVSTLLNDLESAQKEISGEMHQLFEYIVQQNKNIAEEKKKVCDITFNLEREKRKLDTDKEIIKEKAEGDAELKYYKECENAKLRADNLEKTVDLLKEQIDEFRSITAFLESNNKTPEEILRAIEEIKQENSDLKKELLERPTEDDLNTKRVENANLEAKVNELRGKINEQELNELRARIVSNDSYVLEIQTYKDRLESSKARERSLKKTIDDLTSTIDQLKGERDKDGEAFQFAQMYDNDFSLGEKKFFESCPENLNDFAEYMQNKIFTQSDKGFCYSLDTIRIFIAGIHMSAITILQGISGTGKTSLPREFAEAMICDQNYKNKGLENSPNAPYRICAIQSGWRDNMDLIGYYNSFEHKYKETDFFKALYLANLPKYRDTLFFIILDEMNLSRPEHYFADFLSLLEQDEDKRYITINAPLEVLPQKIIEGKLRVPQNVRFIGTANHDETTLEFAPKTYDRSNVIELPKNKSNENIYTTHKAFNISYNWLKTQFEMAEDDYDDECNSFESFINSDEFKFLLAEKGIGIGNRFEAQARRFISAFIATGDRSESTKSLAIAADHLITTRLLRTLKNRYDLSIEKLREFRDYYIKLFTDEFENEPTFAINLIEEEINRKDK